LPFTFYLLPFQLYSIDVRLKICNRCKRPFLANKEFCTHCPAPYNPDSLANIGCLLAMMLPLFMVVFFWIFLFFGVFFR